jgi:hypothetical protein
MNLNAWGAGFLAMSVVSAVACVASICLGNMPACALSALVTFVSYRSAQDETLD